MKNYMDEIRSFVRDILFNLPEVDLHALDLYVSGKSARMDYDLKETCKLDLRQLVLTAEMIDFIRKDPRYQPGVTLNGFAVSRERLMPMSSQKIVNLSHLESFDNIDPIDITFDKYKNGKSMYKISNGRHRVAESILRGYQSINVNCMML